MSQWENVYFLSHVNIKNIIGKELINDDNVAVAELVKNSYDAGASKVVVEFKNLKEKRELQEIIIVDDGEGMDRDDILQKWLNLAYSIKRVQSAKNNRLQAGNKGIGRFSCDRLGKKLDIYTKKDKKIYHLKINWQDFEDVEDYSVQINEIPMQLREIAENDVKNESGYKFKKSGTIIKISHFRNSWVKLNNDSLFNDILNHQKFTTLKSTLEKLINKSQVDSGNFKIFLKAKDIDDENKLTYNEKINGEIKNRFFEKLDFDTTYIHSAISEDGKYITTKLKDRDKTIFKVIEKNIEFPKLKAIKIILMYLNPYAKVYFEKQMGIRSVDFGSVYLFVNGFRIPPYGDIENDSFGMEVRKTQGRSRYISNREVIGRIEIEDREDNFKVISSREGIVQDEPYKQLIHKSTKSKVSQTKNNGFFYKTLRRLEKFVVSGIKWDSVSRDFTETKIKALVSAPNWNQNKEKYILSYEEKIKNIAIDIFRFLSLDYKNIVDFYLSKDIIYHLIEEDTLQTQKNITKFLKEFSKIPSYAIDEKTKQAVQNISKQIDDEKLMKKVNFTLDNTLSIDEMIDKELYYGELDKKIKITENENQALKAIKIERDFYANHHSSDKQKLLDFHHSIGTSAETIDNFLTNIKNRVKNQNVRRPMNDEYLLKTLEQISFENHKILTISNLATKAGFRADSENRVDDIMRYIYDYINKICLGNIKTLDHNSLSINIDKNTNKSFKIDFKPIEISMIIDNLISNAKNAGATQINFLLDVLKDEFLLKCSDNGKEIEANLKDKIFNLGYTTTNGSGMGLAHIVKIIKSINGTVKLETTDKTTFAIRIIKDESSI